LKHVSAEARPPSERRDVEASTQTGGSYTLRQLWETALETTQNSNEFEPWVLWEWRRVSILEWRRILNDASELGDSRRQDYASWMLEEILLDPEV
jgi:hypothetical protein